MNQDSSINTEENKEEQKQKALKQDSIEQVQKFKDLFNNKFLFKIPNYQRPYSWEIEQSVNHQVERFWLDIQEYKDSPYYLGHFLFEASQNNNGNRYNIVDGQQRFTTILLFLKAIYEIDNNLLYYNTYFKNSKGYYILEVITYDNEIFQQIMGDVIISNQKYMYTFSTSSSERMFKVKDYFKRKLKEKLGRINESEINLKYEEKELLKSYVNTILEAKISSSLVQDRYIANQVFMFHNNRGKALTNLDKIKSFLINLLNKSRLYHDNELIENTIENEIDSNFKKIFQFYSTIETKIFNTSEDNILNYHFQVFQNLFVNESGFNFDDFEINPTKYGLEDINNKDFIKSIKNFVIKLATSYQYILEIVSTAEEKSETGLSIANVLVQGASVKEYAMLLALKYYIAEKNISWQATEIKQSLKLMEINLFRQNFCGIRTQTNSFGGIAYRFHNDSFHKWKQEFNKKDKLETMLEVLKNYCDIGFKDYWNLKVNFINYFDYRDSKVNNFFGGLKDPTKFLLWKYENYLKLISYGKEYESIIPVKDFIEKDIYKTLEHVYPQNPKKPNDDKQDDEDKKIGNIVHELGNLILLSKSTNSSFNNKMPVDKYNDDKKPFASNLEHHQHITKNMQSEEGRNKWTYDKLNETNNKNYENIILQNSKHIKNFALAYFNYHPVKILKDGNEEHLNVNDYSNLQTKLGDDVIDNSVQIIQEEGKAITILEDESKFNLKFF